MEASSRIAIRIRSRSMPALARGPAETADLSMLLILCATYNPTKNNYSRVHCPITKQSSVVNYSVWSGSERHEVSRHQHKNELGGQTKVQTLTKLSIVTDCTEWCALRPTRTILGVYIRPFSSRRPDTDQQASPRAFLITPWGQQSTLAHCKLCRDISQW